MDLDDLAAISEWFWDFEDVALFDRSFPVPVNAKVLRESWRQALEFADPPRAVWFVAEDAEQRIKGAGGIQAINYIHGDAILPMFVARDTRDKGLGTAMSVSLIDLGFDQLGLHRLTTYYREDNKRTHKALAKLGFREEGRIREGWLANGTRMDVVQVGLLKSEWSGARGGLLEDLSASGLVMRNTPRKL
ncbi:MAG: GNAT family protein [Pseudomonadota bacterium]